MIVIIIIVNTITKKEQKWQRTTERAKFEIKVKWQSVKCYYVNIIYINN